MFNRPHRFTIALLASMAGAAALLPNGGCHSDAPILARGEQFDRPWLLMGSEDLRVRTMIDQPNKWYDDNHLLHVSVPVRNTSDQQLYIQYRLFFYDERGAQVGVPVTERLTIPARGLVEIDGVSTSAAAGGPMPFRLELRYPRVNE